MNKIMAFMSVIILTSLLGLLNSACTNKSNTVMGKNKTADISSGDNKYIISAPIVIKYFMKKNGHPTDQKEYYIQRSIADYFIKFCESNINREEVETHFPSSTDELNFLKMEVEFREGYWDICDDNYNQQSRVGKYVVIHRIITD